VLGADGGETVLPLAALCNGAAGTVLELDEGHRFAAGHPAIHVLPALLADAEIGYGDSDAFVRSFVAGYEVAVRTARAVGTLESGYHPHGVWGRSAARPQWHALADSTGDDALGHGHRGELRATHPVRGGDGGRDRAERLRRHEQPRGAGRRRSGGSRVRRLGERRRAAPRIRRRRGRRGSPLGGTRRALGAGTRLLQDPRRVCRYTHPTLDAIAALPDGLDAAAVESVRVETYPAAARLTESRPQNQLQAKFSIPFAVATALLRGETGPTAFVDEAITSEAIALAERVTVAVDDEIAARAPEQRGARVIVETANERFSRGRRPEEAASTTRSTRGGSNRSSESWSRP